MSKANQHSTILLSIAGFAVIIAVVVVVGLFQSSGDKDVIQGQVEVTEYRVSSKVAGRIVELRVQEGDYVHVGDTLAILDVPEVQAKMQQAQSAEEAAAAMERKALNGTRQEQIQSTHSVLQQAQASFDIAEKSYRRIQHLFDEGVMSAQKRDEAYAHYRAAEAQMHAAQSQYDMAVNGARREDKDAATAQVSRARGAVDEVGSYVRETVQTAQMEGEVTDVYPKLGELVGTGRRPTPRHHRRLRHLRLCPLLQQGDPYARLLSERPRHLRRLEGHQGQRRLRPEDLRGQGPPHRPPRRSAARHVAGA